MPIDLNTPADNALISTFPAHIRQAKAEVQGAVSDISIYVGGAQQAAVNAQASAELAQSYAESMREIESASVDGSGDLLITYSDATVENAGSVVGPQGEPGPQGPQGDTGPQGEQGLQGLQGMQGATGPAGTDGIDGTDGRGITSIIRTSGTGAPGTTDTYTVTFTDATTTTFNVYNGADGLGTGDMRKDVYDPDADGLIAFAQLSGVAAASHDHTGTYQPVMGADDNYVTDAEKAALHSHSNKTALDAVSGTNTGDQDLSGYSLTSHNHSLANLTEKSYNSLTDKPSIPSITGLLDETAHDLLDHTGLSGVLALGTTGTTACAGNDSRLSDARTPTSHTTSSHSDWPSDVSMTEVGYLDGVTSSIQTQFNGKAAANQTFYIGTTQVAINRASAALTLAGITLAAPVLSAGYTESVYNLTGTEINPANGSIQYKTLSGNTTFTEALADGQSVTLMLNPATYTTTWPTTTWIGSVASTAPTLIASVYNCITFFRIAGTLYGKYEGRV